MKLQNVAHISLPLGYGLFRLQKNWLWRPIRIRVRLQPHRKRLRVRWGFRDCVATTNGILPWDKMIEAAKRRLSS